jgi:hypothetical protein
MGCSGTRLIDERVSYTASVTYKPLRGGVSDPGAAGALYRYLVRMTSSGPGPDHHTPRMVPWGAQVPA